MNSLRLGFNKQAMARAFCAAAAVGGGLTPLWICSLDRALDLQWRTYPLSSQSTPGLVMLGALVAAGLAMLVPLIRQPNGARLSWDGWGITEWDGEGARTAIALDQVQVGTMETRWKRKGSQAPGMTIGNYLTLGDAAGRRIYVTAGVQLAWLNDRLSTTPDLAPILPVVKDAGRMPPDLGRKAENSLAGWWFVAIAGYVCLALGFGIMTQPHATQDPARPLILAGAGLLFLRSLAPLRRWLATRREGAALSNATAVRLTGNEGTIVNAITPDDRPLRFDVGGLNHPDAAIATRRGEAFVVLDATGACAALETIGIRKARKHRARSALLELGLRFSLVPLSLAVVLAPGVFGSSGGQITVLAGGDGSGLLRAGSFSASGAQLVRVSGRLELIQTTPGAVPHVIDMGPNNIADAIALDPRGTSAFLYRPSSGLARWDLSKAYDFQAEQKPPLEGRQVVVLALSPDGQRLAAADAFGKVTLWDLPASSPRVVRPPGPRINALAFSPDGTVLAGAGASILWWDAASGVELGSVEQPASVVAVGHALIASCAGKVCRVLGQADQVEVGRLETSEPATALELVSRTQLLVASRDQQIVLWDLESQRALKRWSLRSVEALRESHTPPWATLLEPAADGRLLAFLSNGALVELGQSGGR